MSSFLSSIPDNTHLSNILLPGTHESYAVCLVLANLTTLLNQTFSMALLGWPIAACQNSNQTILQQLQSGIRVFDIRLAAINNATTLTAYHGIIDEDVSFADIIATFQAFLSSSEGQSETVVMSIKQENGSSVPDLTFSELVNKEVMATSGSGSSLIGKGVKQATTGGQPLPAPAPGKASVVAETIGDVWYLENRVPTLGEVRGKIILFSRFGTGVGWAGGLAGMGISPMVWPDSDSSGFQWSVGDTTFKMQDWFVNSQET